jgi:Flp pilus assembly pilin Flp
MLTILHGNVHRFVVDERAATAIEYALIASGVAVAIAATGWNLGSEIKTTSTIS